MSSDVLLQLTREALVLVTMVVAPPVLAALVIGLVIGIVQAVTQVQDQSLSLAVRVVAVFAALAIAGPWAFGQVTRFATHVLALAAHL